MCRILKRRVSGSLASGNPAPSLPTLQRRAVRSEEAETVPPVVQDVLRSPGRPLDMATRAFFEPRFGRDFSNVRIHTDVRDAESARAVHALAYTVGHHVVLGPGQYAPGTTAGLGLLAHELTHVVQQKGQSPSRIGGISSPADRCEREASLSEETILRQGTLSSLSPSNVLIQRQDGGAPPPAGPDAGAPPGAVGGAAPPVAGAGGAAPAVAPAGAALGLTATRIAFGNSGAPDADDCAIVKPAALGVGAPGPAENGMEMTFRINGAIPPGTEFDILRTRVGTDWQRDAASVWSVLERQPAGTNDDQTNDDECLTPKSGRLFVVDTPGMPRLDPRGITLLGGSTVSPTATGFVMKFSFAEWVIARNRPMGINWEVISDPTFSFWHSITSLLLVGGSWTLADTPSGQHNEIKLGSINIGGASP